MIWGRNKLKAVQTEVANASITIESLQKTCSENSQLINDLLEQLAAVKEENADLKRKLEELTKQPEPVPDTVKPVIKKSKPGVSKLGPTEGVAEAIMHT